MPEIYDGCRVHYKGTVLGPSDFHYSRRKKYAQNRGDGFVDENKKKKTNFIGRYIGSYKPDNSVYQMVLKK